MGIKNFRTNLIKTFLGIVSHKKPNNIHTLCIDGNGILHKICHRTKNKEGFKKNLIGMLKKIIKKNKPSFVAIFIDGQAILAKANTQIKRRNKYLYATSNGISSLNLTPGTPFMDFVDETITEYLNTLNIKHYYSSSKENNEGELKIFEWLLKNNIQNTICIVGNDADLIVLALASRPLLNVYIYNEENYLSLFKLIHNLAQKYSSKKFSYNWHPIRMDFVLLSLFQGNDYNNRLSQFNNLLSSYNKLQKKKKGFLINKTGMLNLINIKKLFNNINTIDTIIYTQSDVNEYFKAIQWNLNLYQGKINNRFIPNYNNININSAIEYFPNSIEPINENINWVKKEAFTLLLMPITGREYLPQHLKHYLNKESPVKDLFPDPCLECISWKQKLKEIIRPCDDASTDEIDNYKKLISTTNVAYNKHIKENHIINDLPIERLENLFI